jgi:hypothetical protein
MVTATQLNVRISDPLLDKATIYAQKHGFSNVQELIKESLREKIFEESLISKEELMLVKKLAQVTEEKNLWGTEQELFKKLKR